MEDAFEGAKDLYRYEQKLFSFWGLWPLKSTYIRFSLWILYLLIHMVLGFKSLYNDWGQLNLMVMSLSELTLEIMILTKMFVIRFSKKLVNVMIKILNEVDVNKFENDEERKIYLGWNEMAKSSFRMWFIISSVATVWYYLKPLEFRIKAALTNETLPYVVPYRRLFFEVNNSMTFWLVWFYQVPVMAINMIHVSSIGYLFSLILHVCGHLSILALRIKNLDIRGQDNPQGHAIIFRKIVENHQHVIRLAHDIDNVFKLPLLEELCISTVILGLTAYCVLVNSDEGELSETFSFLLYALTILLLLYGYCIAGENLVTESVNVYNSYYNCEWDDFSEAFKKQLMICMIGASNPLHVTGGGFYIFNRAGFMGILKTAMGYISLLRTMT